MLAVQADGCSVETVESLEHDGRLNIVQQAFCDRTRWQCGFCTPGLLLTVRQLLAERPRPRDDEIRRDPGRERVSVHGLREDQGGGVRLAAERGEE